MLRIFITRANRSNYVSFGPTGGVSYAALRPTPPITRRPYWFYVWLERQRHQAMQARRQVCIEGGWLTSWGKPLDDHSPRP